MEERNLIEIKNKRATFEYFLVSTYTAGLVLTGTEIKSIREGKANLSDAFCSFREDELYVSQLYISEYIFGTHYNHDPKRDRKLLLNRNELRKLQSKTKEKGFTIIPVMLFVDARGFAKLDIALAKGKKFFDKRETIKQKDSKREIERAQKSNY